MPIEIAKSIFDKLQEKPIQNIVQGHYGQMAPKLAYGRHYGPAPQSARQAAVLVLLRPNESHSDLRSMRIVLTVRSKKLQQHPGQVSFPGGQIDAGETVEEAALREANEELALDAKAVRVCGQLPGLYVYNSHFWVRPVIAVAQHVLQFEANKAEVDEVFELPMRSLAHHAVQKTTISRGLIRWTTPCFVHESHKIWGATSMILAGVQQLAKTLAPQEF